MTLIILLIVAVVIGGRIIRWKPQRDHRPLTPQAIKDRLGHEGEALVAKELKGLSGEYHTYNDLLLKVDNRGIGSTQIDHLVLSKYGIFVIETKNWAGKIYGKREYKSWVRIKDDGSKNFFGNALHQNDAHIHGLLSFLPRYAGKHIVGLVAFSERGTLIYDEPGVGYTHDVLPTIKSFTNIMYSDRELSRIKRAIDSRILSDAQSAARHVRRAKGARYARSRS